MNPKNGSPTIGLALGSGAARGWAHIGILRALADKGIHPENSFVGAPWVLWLGGFYAAFEA